ncbi:hypothetical protein PRBRB14_19220 [Hallella multisaccharivorax DSM 17128]|nr:hypothetical protein PRBRB14_19220 [Hallella multisaccharivorax DSM 17128]
MKKILMNIKEAAKRFTEFYANAMDNYGEALINSRGLAGA